MERAPILGLISLDVLFIINNLLVLLFYLGLCVVLWPVFRSGVTVALTLGVLQMAAYLVSNPAVEMLDLGRRYAATSGERQGMLLAAGEAVLAAWKGTAYLAYYLLGATVLLVLASLLLRSTVFAGPIPWWALAAGLLMLVPSTFGLVGIVFALVSLIPWSVFCVLAGRRLLQLGRRPPASRARE